jgi:aquaporin Z
MARNLPLYCYVAIELAMFMISACGFTVLLFQRGSFAIPLIPNAACRGVLMGSRWALRDPHHPFPHGKAVRSTFQSTDHSYLQRLKKNSVVDAFFYVLFQFGGGIGGVAESAICFGARLADPSVNYAMTIPGSYGSDTLL